MKSTQITNPAILRRAAWKLYNEPGFQRDKSRREANVSQYGTSALCETCAGTGNAFLFIYKACRACNGTGIESEPLPHATLRVSIDGFGNQAAMAI